MTSTRAESGTPKSFTLRTEGGLVRRVSQHEMQQLVRSRIQRARISATGMVGSKRNLRRNQSTFSSGREREVEAQDTEASGPSASQSVEKDAVAVRPPQQVEEGESEVETRQESVRNDVMCRDKDAEREDLDGPISVKSGGPGTKQPSPDEMGEYLRSKIGDVRTKPSKRGGSEGEGPRTDAPATKRNNKDSETPISYVLGATVNPTRGNRTSNSPAGVSDGTKFDENVVVMSERKFSWSSLEDSSEEADPVVNLRMDKVELSRMESPQARPKHRQSQRDPSPWETTSPRRGTEKQHSTREAKSDDRMLSPTSARSRQRSHRYKVCTRSFTTKQEDEVVRRRSPRHGSPRHGSPQRVSPPHESPRHGGPGRVIPRRLSPRHSSPRHTNSARQARDRRSSSLIVGSSKSTQMESTTVSTTERQYETLSSSLPASSQQTSLRSKQDMGFAADDIASITSRSNETKAIRSGSQPRSPKRTTTPQKQNGATTSHQPDQYSRNPDKLGRRKHGLTVEQCDVSESAEPQDDARKPESNAQKNSPKHAQVQSPSATNKTAKNKSLLRLSLQRAHLMASTETGEGHRAKPTQPSTPDKSDTSLSIFRSLSKADIDTYVKESVHRAQEAAQDEIESMMSESMKKARETAQDEIREMVRESIVRARQRVSNDFISDGSIIIDRIEKSRKKDEAVFQEAEEMKAMEVKDMLIIREKQGINEKDTPASMSVTRESTQSKEQLFREDWRRSSHLSSKDKIRVDELEVTKQEEKKELEKMSLATQDAPSPKVRTPLKKKHFNRSPVSQSIIIDRIENGKTNEVVFQEAEEMETMEVKDMLIAGEKQDKKDSAVSTSVARESKEPLFREDGRGSSHLSSKDKIQVDELEEEKKKLEKMSLATQVAPSPIVRTPLKKDHFNRSPVSQSKTIEPKADISSDIKSRIEGSSPSSKPQLQLGGMSNSGRDAEDPPTPTSDSSYGHRVGSPFFAKQHSNLSNDVYYGTLMTPDYIQESGRNIGADSEDQEGHEQKPEELREDKEFEGPKTQTPSASQPPDHSPSQPAKHPPVPMTIASPRSQTSGDARYQALVVERRVQNIRHPGDADSGQRHDDPNSKHDTSKSNPALISPPATPPAHPEATFGSSFHGHYFPTTPRANDSQRSQFSPSTPRIVENQQFSSGLDPTDRRYNEKEITTGSTMPDTLGSEASFALSYQGGLLVPGNLNRSAGLRHDARPKLQGCPTNRQPAVPCDEVDATIEKAKSCAMPGSTGKPKESADKPNPSPRPKANETKIEPTRRPKKESQVAAAIRDDDDHSTTSLKLETEAEANETRIESSRPKEEAKVAAAIRDDDDRSTSSLTLETEAEANETKIERTRPKKESKVAAAIRDDADHSTSSLTLETEAEANETKTARTRPKKESKIAAAIREADDDSTSSVTLETEAEDSLFGRRRVDMVARKPNRGRSVARRPREKTKRAFNEVVSPERDDSSLCMSHDYTLDTMTFCTSVMGIMQEPVDEDISRLTDTSRKIARDAITMQRAKARSMASLGNVASSVWMDRITDNFDRAADQLNETMNNALVGLSESASDNGSLKERDIYELGSFAFSQGMVSEMTGSGRADSDESHDPCHRSSYDGKRSLGCILM